MPSHGWHWFEIEIQVLSYLLISPYKRYSGMLAISLGVLRGSFDVAPTKIGEEVFSFL